MRSFVRLALVAAMAVAPREAAGAVLSHPDGSFTVDLAPLEGHGCTMVPEAVEGLPVCANRPTGTAKQIAAAVGPSNNVVALIQLTRGEVSIGSVLVIFTPRPSPHELDPTEAREFQAGVVEGMSAKLPPGSDTEPRWEELRVNGLQVLKTVGDVVPQPGAASLRQSLYAFITAGGNYGVTFTSTMSEAKATEALADTVIATIHARRAGPSMSADYRAGYLFGRIFFLIIPALVGFGLLARSILRSRRQRALALPEAPPRRWPPE
jgi:hypothetical protein